MKAFMWFSVGALWCSIAIQYNLTLLRVAIGTVLVLILTDLLIYAFRKKTKVTLDKPENGA